MLTYFDKVHQAVVDEGAFGKEEAATWAEVMEEEQVLLLGTVEQTRHSYTFLKMSRTVENLLHVLTP